MDVNKRGKINKKEFTALLKELEIYSTKEQVDILFGNLDKNKDGDITLQEFIAGLSGLKKGAQMSSELDLTADVLQKQNEVLIKYAHYTTSLILERAEEAAKSNQFKTCFSLFDLLDVTVIKELDDYVGNIVPENFSERYENLKKTLAANRKK
eukprot:TRINITY_DN6663_c0_g1_i1.p1 TRINITY_DN6663_c0_g1~~TRINITY_DN6663_c0_g1_i1.p1  ORF type:complete len:153 (+),score=50.46 TRINITY_DN6663_c0_g1_i1:436-894(+)